MNGSIVRRAKVVVSRCASLALRLTMMRERAVRPGEESGMSTSEYAVGIMAACTFALVLLGVVRSDAIRNALTGIVQNALGLAG